MFMMMLAAIYVLFIVTFLPSVLIKIVLKKIRLLIFKPS